MEQQYKIIFSIDNINSGSLANIIGDLQDIIDRHALLHKTFELHVFESSKLTTSGGSGEIYRECERRG